MGRRCEIARQADTVGELAPSGLRQFGGNRDPGYSQCGIISSSGFEVV